VFENIIEQGAVLQLREDITTRRYAPSMLFYGPPETGKGSTALELSRALSCETDASWKCACPSCERHRYLQHQDLLILGPRPFQAEIAACASAFLRNPSSAGAKTLFIRSLRKLQIRFSALLMEDDPKLGKLSPILRSLEENSSEFWLLKAESAERAALEKLCGALIKDALSLIGEGIGDTIPIGHIRRASYWCRLAPNGKRKTLIIENADNMRDDARNSLLKLLEEPPDTVNIVLTTQRREAIMPTILSRLRPYRFLRRSVESEKEVIRRVFQDSLEARSKGAKDAQSIEEKALASGSSLVSAYLDSFLEAGADKMYPLAAWFVASVARIAAHSLKRNRTGVPNIINALGERYAPIADTAGFERTFKIAAVVKKIIDESGNFEETSFSRFIKLCLEMICAVTREESDPLFIAYSDMFKKYCSEAITAAEVLNQNKTIALEALLYKLKVNMLRARFLGGVNG
jgi:DNA polymerase-3 subunit gamma/tau